MQIINSMAAIHQLRNENMKTAISIGKFDGIHAGHQVLLNKVLEKRREGMKAMVFTFFPSPEELFKGEHLPAIDTVVEKRQGFEKMGIDILVEYPLTFETASVSPVSFVEEILLRDLKAAYIVSGTDLSFGNHGSGNAELLEKLANENHFEYELIEKVEIDNIVVSSTTIRSAIEEGNIELANRLLKRNYQLTGIVEKGKQLGRTIDLPTINITADPQKLLPKRGVYVSKSLIDGNWYYGISNVGKKPTVKDNDVVNVETNLFDVNMDLYGKCVTTEFLSFVRAEQRFSSIDELAAQMKRDREYGKTYVIEHEKG